jgi:septal ring factor EnvC (AmiA/AmiB activator)
MICRLVCILALCLSLLVPAASLAAPPGSKKPSASTLATGTVINIGKLREEISLQQEKIIQAAAEEHSLLDELATLDNKIAQQTTKTQSLSARLSEQNKMLEVRKKELSVLEQQHDILRQHLLKRLRVAYLLRQTGFFNIVFSGKALPDLMLTNDALHELAIYDQKIFTEYRHNREAIERVQRTQELEKSIQEHFLSGAEQESTLLRQVAEEKNVALKRIRTEKGLYEQALREMKKAEEQMLVTLAQSSKLAPGQKALGFVANRGTLPPPVAGQVTRRFLEPVAAGEDPAFTNGITILAPDHAEVVAVYGGMVLFSGYMAGYGKMVIIEHDQDYCSVTARIDALSVQEGDAVKQGQTIATTGNASILFGKGLYFEIRHGVRPENPLDWLSPTTLSHR